MEMLSRVNGHMSDPTFFTLAGMLVTLIVMAILDNKIMTLFLVGGWVILFPPDDLRWRLYETLTIFNATAGTPSTLLEGTAAILKETRDGR